MFEPDIVDLTDDATPPKDAQAVGGSPWAVGPVLEDDLFTLHGSPSDGAIGIAKVCCFGVETGYSAAIMRDGEELYRFTAPGKECAFITISPGRTYIRFFDGALPTHPVGFKVEGKWRRIR